MRRLPVELMARIIGLVKQPLPEIGDPKATMKELCQNDLASLMRVSKMMYHLTAPVLYKEVVIGNFAQFFYGVGEQALQSEKLPPGQSRICCSISKGVRPYYCLRHPPPAGDHDVTVYTKRQLLGLVQAMYLVYTPQDTIELSKARPDDFDDGQDLLHHLDEAIDLRRYTDIPHPIQSSDTLFPKLNRLVAGSWCIFDWSRPRDDLVSTQLYGEFETTLAKRMFQITPPYVCKLHFSEGPFRYYPSKPDSIKVNILHDAQFDSFGGSLLPGVLNIVHINLAAKRTIPRLVKSFSRPFTIALILSSKRSATGHMSKICEYTTITRPKSNSSSTDPMTTTPTPRPTPRKSKPPLICVI